MCEGDRARGRCHVHECQSTVRDGRVASHGFSVVICHVNVPLTTEERRCEVGVQRRMVQVISNVEVAVRGSTEDAKGNAIRKE